MEGILQAHNAIAPCKRSNSKGFRESSCVVCNNSGSVSFACPEINKLTLQNKALLKTALSKSPDLLEELVENDSKFGDQENSTDCYLCDECFNAVQESASINKEIKALHKKLGIYRGKITQKLTSFLAHDKENISIDNDGCFKEPSTKLRKITTCSVDELGFELIKKTRVPNPFSITIIEKEEKVPEKKKAYYNLLLLKVHETDVEFVEARLFEKRFDLEVGYTYIVKGKIVKEELSRIPVRSRSECSQIYKLWKLWSVKKDEIQKAINVDPGHEFHEKEAILTIPKVKEYCSVIPHKQFKYRLLKGVQLVCGEVYRYVGCKKCQRANPNLEETGLFKCRQSICGFEGTADQVLKTFMIIQNMVIKDSDGNVLENIVCYNDTAKILFGKDADQFLFDDEMDAAFEEYLGSEINLRLSYQPTYSPYSKDGYQIVAITISVQKRNAQIPSIELDAKSFPATPPTTAPKTVGLKLSFSGHANEGYEIARKSDSTSPLASEAQYKLDSNPSGYALIINVMEYQDHNDRIGSEIDVQNIIGVLRYLNFEVFGGSREKFCKTELEADIKRFKCHLKNRNISSCLVFVMGHGANDHLKLSDGETVNVFEGIVDHFSTKQFPAFDLKPKMFVFNMCRTISAKLSRNIITQRVRNAFFCFSTIPGHPSVRSPTEGSFFVDCLVKKLWKLAEIRDWKTIMDEVQHEMDTHYQQYKIEYPDGDLKDAELMTSDFYGRIFGKFVFNVPKTANEKLEPRPNRQIMDYDIITIDDK